MSDLLREDVQVWFDPDLNGTLPDVHVPGTTVEDWRTLVDLVRSEGWQFAYLVDGEARHLPAAVEDMLSLRNEAGVQLNVWPVSGVLAIFRPYEAEQIDFVSPCASCRDSSSWTSSADSWPRSVAGYASRC